MIATKIENPKKSSSKAERAGGLADYIRNPEHENGLEKCIHSEAVNFLTKTPEAQKLEMISLSQEAIRSKDPVDHWVLSWKHNERPTVDQVREAVSIFIKHCGLVEHQHIWGLHDDTENMHVHIEINRVHPDTVKVIKINKGFDKEASQQAIAIIEKKQGWSIETKARYRTNDKAELIIDPQTKRPQIFAPGEKQKEPTGHAKRMEIQTGEKSAQRLGIETAPQIISAATSWADLHARMQAAGMEYRRDGSGAKIFIGDVGVKASDVVDRKNNFGALQKRLGLYQPANTPEIKNDPINRTQLITDDRFSTGYDQPHTAPARLGTFNTLRDLPRSDLDVTNTTNRQASKNQNLLQSHESPDNRRTSGVRRGSDSDSTERSARSKSIGVVLVQHQPGWTQYQQIKEANDSAKNAERLELAKRHDTEKAELMAKQKAERTALFAGNWKGKGDALNDLRSSTATLQAADTLELEARQREEKKALRAKYKPVPDWKTWKEQPQILGIGEELQGLEITRAQPPRLSQILKSLSRTTDQRHHTTYSLNGRSVFRDEGRVIQVLDLKSDEGIAAALATAQQKFGNMLTLTGSPEFQKNAVAIAVANNLTCKFAEPALESLRTRLQADKYQAERDAARAERDREAAAQLEKSKAIETLPPAPVHSPSSQTAQRGIDEPGTGAERELSRKAPAAEPAKQVSTLTPEQAAADAAKGIQEATARVKQATDLAALAEALRIEQEEKAEAEKVAQAEADEVQKGVDDEKAAEEHRLSEPVQLADIHQQIAAAQAAETNRNAPIHSAKISEATEADYQKGQHGIVLASNESFVAVRKLDIVTIYKTAELSKNVTYDGVATGHGRFAPGNEIERKDGEDGMRTLLSEEREHMQTEAKRERERERDIGHGL